MRAWLGALPALVLAASGPSGGSPDPRPALRPRAIGGTLALLCRSDRPSGATARVLVLSGDAWRTRADVEARRIRWSPDGAHLVLTGAEAGPILALAVAGAEPPWRVAEAGASAACSPDGSAIAFARPDGGVCLADLRTRTVRDVPGTERGYAPAWHPDGKRLAFARSVGGSGSLWMVPVGGGAAERIGVCARPLSLAWSPDGSHLAVVVYDPDRMTLPQLGVLTPGDPVPAHVCAVRSADFRWISSESVAVFDASGGAVRVRVSRGGIAPEEAVPTDAIVAGVADGTVLAVARGANGAYELRTASGPGDRRVRLPALPRGLTVLDAAWTDHGLPAAQTTESANAHEPDRAIGPPVAERTLVTPMVFPVCGPVSWTNTFGHPRGPTRRHAGQDLMAPKMRPVVAAFDGIVTLRRATQPGGHNWLILVGDNGWTATYLHLNNDTPGTDDGLGTELYAFAPGLATGDRVRAGQLLGYVGDSGNAENTAPHLHFELAPTATRVPIDPGPSLELAERLEEPRSPNDTPIP